MKKRFRAVLLSLGLLFLLAQPAFAAELGEAQYYTADYHAGIAGKPIIESFRILYLLQGNAAHRKQLLEQ